MDIFTPLNEQGQRLRFRQSSVRIISGDLNVRGLGKKAVVEIAGKRYTVYGKACNAPHCQCDAVIKPL